MTRADDYGCWSCGNREGRVITTGHDDDGNRIRLRRCTACGDRWVTEERRLAREVTFSQRADSARESQRARRKRHSRTCGYCGGRYNLGYYDHHVATAKRHLAWKADREAYWQRYKREDARWRYHADPVYRQTQLERGRKAA